MKLNSIILKSKKTNPKSITINSSVRSHLHWCVVQYTYSLVRSFAYSFVRCGAPLGKHGLLAHHCILSSWNHYSWAHATLLIYQIPTLYSRPSSGKMLLWTHANQSLSLWYASTGNHLNVYQLPNWAAGYASTASQNSLKRLPASNLSCRVRLNFVPKITNPAYNYMLLSLNL